MDKKLKFNTLLTELVEIANDMGNMIDKETVDSHFKELDLETGMYTAIYHYLNENKITITGIAPDAAKNNINQTFGVPEDFDISKEEASFVKMYYDELKNIPELTEDEERILVNQLIQNDPTVKNQLIEANLKLVISCVERYRNQGVSVGDLIQEGNLGLMEGISTFNGNGDRIYQDFKEHLNSSIAYAMQNSIDEQIGSSRINEHLASRANSLDITSKELADTLGREPTMEELSKYTSLPEEELRNIMKYSLDALNTIE